MKFKSEKRRVKNEKGKNEKNQLLLEKVKILHSYWTKNLKLSQSQFSKIFLGSTDMTKSLGQKRAKNNKGKITSKLLLTTSDPKKIFEKPFNN